MNLELNCIHSISLAYLEQECKWFTPPVKHSLQVTAPHRFARHLHIEKCLKFGTAVFVLKWDEKGHHPDLKRPPLAK